MTTNLNVKSVVTATEVLAPGQQRASVAPADIVLGSAHTTGGQSILLKRDKIVAAVRDLEHVKALAQARRSA